jgi:cytochrome c-type biogenesis protein CcmH
MARLDRAIHAFAAAALIIILALPSLALAQTVTRDGVTLTQAQETRAEGIGDQLRCLVCQNESIEGSSAALAHQLRVIIRQHVVAGDSNKSIMDFMVQRYGIFVLLKPPLSPLTLLLYAMPFLAVALGLLGFWLTRRNRVAPVAPLDERERERLKSLLET